MTFHEEVMSSVQREVLRRIGPVVEDMGFYLGGGTAVYALGTARFDPEEMLDLYRAKYSTEDLGHVLMSLSYFDDAEREEPPEMLWDVSWDEVRRTLERWVLELAG